MKKHYKTLGLKKDSTIEEVEKKYKQLLKEFNPKKQSEDLKDFFKTEQDKVKEAYEEISLNFTNKKETEEEEEVIFNEVDEIEKEFEDIESNHSDENDFREEEEKGMLFQFKKIFSNLHKKYGTRVLVLILMNVILVIFLIISVVIGVTQHSEKNNSFALYLERISNYRLSQEYNSGCSKRRTIKIDNNSNKTVKVYMKRRENTESGDWTEWEYWTISPNEESKCRDINNKTLYLTDYKYYITDMNGTEIQYSKAFPQTTDICSQYKIRVHR